MGKAIYLALGSTLVTFPLGGKKRIYRNFPHTDVLK